MEHPPLQLTRFVTAADVQRSLNCARSTAYDLLREAAGRKRGERGMLRVPVDLWEAFIRQRFAPAAAASQAPLSPPLRPTQPRPRRAIPGSPTDSTP